jgi:ribosomal-protein-alanine N-acetyltransferase
MNGTHKFNFNEFPVLTTERLILRNLCRSDAVDVLVFRSDPIVQKYDDPFIQTIVESEALIDQLHAEFDTQEGINWGVTLAKRDVVIGIFSLHSIDQYHHRAEAGYGLAHAYWGQGIATEALWEIIRFGFEELSLHRIYARTISDNHESVRLLKRSGFKLEGIQREHSWEDDGTFHDSAIYGLLECEFRN